MIKFEQNYGLFCCWYDYCFGIYVGNLVLNLGEQAAV